MTSPLPAPLRPRRLQHDPWGQLLMETDDGQKFSAVVPVRAFPVSDPDHWISICDGHGQEILSIDDIRADCPLRILVNISPRGSLNDMVS